MKWSAYKFSAILIKILEPLLKTQKQMDKYNLKINGDKKRIKVAYKILNRKILWKVSPYLISNYTIESEDKTHKSIKYKIPL